MYALCWTEQYHSAKKDRLQEMNNVDIAVLKETRLPGCDSLEDHGYMFLWSGRSTQERREAGVGFAVRRGDSSNA